MRIYNYIAKKFWGPFFFALGVFTTLVVLGDTFEKMKNLSNGTTTILDLLAGDLSQLADNHYARGLPAGCDFRHFRNGFQRRVDGLRGGRLCPAPTV